MKNRIKNLNIYIEERVLKEADFVIETKKTVREVAKKFKVSKSTIHRDFTELLPEISYNKSLIVKEILEKNKEERSLRGGIATSKVYAKRKGNKRV